MVVLTRRYSLRNGVEPCEIQPGEIQPGKAEPPAKGQRQEGQGSPVILALTAADRVRSRYRHLLPNGEPAYLQLPRDTCLHHGDLLATEDAAVIIQVVAKPEPVMTVQAATPLALLKAAYHLGNRHVPLEVTAQWLRLSPDPVLKSLLVDQLQLTVIEEIAPFQPEVGAYHSHQAHHHAS